jgi:predicted nuclease of predicted toxin-antitoxin system
LRFLVDAQLPPALARMLESLGHVAEHVADRGLAAATDTAIRQYAASVGAVIVTKDEDFAVHRLLREGASIVWIRIGNTRRDELLRRIEAELSAIVAALEQGETLVEIV